MRPCAGSPRARELGIPVTGGNVSFYNQTGDVAIHPTPVVGVLGVMDDVSVPGATARRGRTRAFAPRPALTPTQAAEMRDALAPVAAFVERVLRATRDLDATTIHLRRVRTRAVMHRSTTCRLARPPVTPPS